MSCRLATYRLAGGGGALNWWFELWGRPLTTTRATCAVIKPMCSSFGGWPMRLWHGGKAGTDHTRVYKICGDECVDEVLVLFSESAQFCHTQVLLVEAPTDELRFSTEDGYDFYTVDGAARLRDRLAEFTSGTIVLGVLSVPFKCPPAPYEAVLLLHAHLVERGIRDAVTIKVISPMPSPIPVSPETSEALITAMAERCIIYRPETKIHSLDPNQHLAHTDTDTEPYDLFIGIPKHRVPDVIDASGLTAGGNDGWIAVDPATLATKHAGVYAIGDCADAPVPRAGVYAEDAAGTVAAHIAAQLHGTPFTAKYSGRGVCYIEFGDGRVGKVDADFLSGSKPTAPFIGPSTDLADEKAEFAVTRRHRWFGRSAS